MANSSKQYGLIMPQKANQGLVRPRPSVFNESSDSEGEGGGGATDWVKKALKRESEKTFQRKQHRVDMEKALAEDPTVYQYDEVYDKIEEKKAEIITAKKQDKKPRYIQSLMLQAEKRKREHERRNERIIQKEREAEGDKFKDKESFVTSAYRAKLEEFKQQEEEERRMDALEAIADVTKQKDLGGFYRHLYRQTVTGEEEGFTLKQEKDNTDPVKAEAGHIVQVEKGEDQEPKIVTEKENIENAESSPQGSDKNNKDNSEKKSSRHYRQRNDSSASSGSASGGEAESKRSQENLDADSDFSVDSDSSESGSNSEKENEQERKKQKNKRKSEESKVTNKNEATTDRNAESKSELHKSSQEENSDNPNKKLKVGDENSLVVSEEKEKIEKKEVKIKTNIWIKRTVGEVFDSALQRYYERKANKLANKG